MSNEGDSEQLSPENEHVADESVPTPNVLAVALVGWHALLRRNGTTEPYARIPGTAISCRFSDAARRGLLMEDFAEAWLVGTEAQAIISTGIIDGTELSKVRESDSHTQIRRRVGLIAALLDEHIDILQTGADLKTVFFLKGDQNKKLTVPPFWLVYALRRFGWPGQVFVRQVKDPKTALAKFEFRPSGPRVLTRPVLGMIAGAFDPETQLHLGPLDPNSNNLPEIVTPIQVELSVAAAKPEAIAPVLSMLPVERSKLLFDSIDGPTGRLTIWGGTSSPRSRNYRVHIGRDDPGGDMVDFGWISKDDAPVGENTAYRVTVEIDVWGRLNVRLSDTNGYPLPIRSSDKRHRKTTQCLPLCNLLFPRAEDQTELLRPYYEHHAQTGRPIEETDSVTLLDNTSFNGRPVTGSALENRDEGVRKPFQTAEFWKNRRVEYGESENRLDRDKIKWMEVARKALVARIDLEDEVNAPFDSLIHHREPDWQHILRQVADGYAVLFKSDLEKLDKTGIVQSDKALLQQERIVLEELMHFTPKAHARLREEIKRCANILQETNT